MDFVTWFYFKTESTVPFLKVSWKYLGCNYGEIWRHSLETVILVRTDPFDPKQIQINLIEETLFFRYVGLCTTAETQIQHWLMNLNTFI